MFNNKLISLTSYEEKLYELNILESQYNLLFNEKIKECEKQLQSFKNKKNEFEHELFDTMEKLELRNVKAPIDGTIMKLRNLSEGSYITAGQNLFIISPNLELIVEAYVEPKDIGLLKKKITGNISIDSFDYNYWGLIKCSIEDISDDSIFIDKKPFFLVRCNLQKNYLKLKNGYKGYLKKGMNAKVIFLIKKRSLFQLLFTNINDWLNPIMN